jgi:molybdopterin-guanine dinucleotide biosynthesis protein A
MGRDKALLPFGDPPLANWMAEKVRAACGNVTLVGSSAKYSGLGVFLIEDAYPEQGPLAGIHAALRYSTAQYNLIVGCDMPYVSTDFLAWLLESAQKSGADVTIPESEGFEYEPLCAVYATRCLGAVEEALNRKDRAIRNLLGRLQVRVVLTAEWRVFDQHGKMFRNLNTAGDYESARAELLTDRGRSRSLS